MDTATKPLLIAIDDEQFYLDEIEYALDGHDIEYMPFLGPSAFEEKATDDDLARANLIVVDYDFRTCTAVDRDLVGYIRERFPDFRGKMVLLSLLDDFFEDDDVVRKKFDAVLNKRDDLFWEKIQAYLH